MGILRVPKKRKLVLFWRRWMWQKLVIKAVLSFAKSWSVEPKVHCERNRFFYFFFEIYILLNIIFIFNQELLLFCSKLKLFTPLFLIRRTTTIPTKELTCSRCLTGTNPAILSLEVSMKHWGGF